ncbi:MAG: sarcosine oxidase subunit gamma [Alphaproteobacteria bacterium]|nr:MAG: sarcosine oxidase subunit gamma [Alphaproteobacteria bacterium]
MAEAARIHPLAGRRLALPGLSLEPCPPAERLSLRAGEDALAAIDEALGLALPRRPMASATAGGLAALWLGPDEWLIVADEGAGLAGRLAALTGIAFSAVDLSHRNTAISIDGDKAVLALAAGCPRDLSPAAFPVGACSRTVLGKAEIVLAREAPARFRVECWRSFADYVWNYLVDAAKSA